MIRPTRVRYIKLGRKGDWEKECLEKGIIRFGYDSASAERFPLCREGQWEELTKSFMNQGKSRGIAANFANQTRAFFEDNGSMLWITFIGECLYWGFVDPAPPERHDDGRGVWRKVTNGWRCTDTNGEQLTKDRLSGALTKLASYRGTSCDVDVSDYVVRRINGLKSLEIERAIVALESMSSSVLELMRFLGPRDLKHSSTWYLRQAAGGD